MGPEEEVCRVSQEMPRPAPPGECPRCSGASGSQRRRAGCGPGSLPAWVEAVFVLVLLACFQREGPQPSKLERREPRPWGDREALRRV